jgi:CheY-like chemotaxis protein
VFAHDVDQHEVAKLAPAGELRPGRCVVLQVRDTGTGMDAATTARIFDPFFTTKLAGRGLGLAAVLGIVRSHRGGIRIASAPQHGSTFDVLFPISEQAAASERSLAPGSARGAGVVLVVDDEQPVRAMVREVLTEIGFRVLEAANGREAIDMFQAHAEQIVAVLLDVNMPGVSGKETLAELRTLRTNLPVLLTSGYDEQEAISRFASTGFTGFLKKPYTVDELIDLVVKASQRQPASV